MDARPIYSKFHDKRRKIAAADRGLKDLQRKARLGLPAETSQFEWIKGKVSFLREWSKEGVDEEFEANTKELLSLSDPGLFECLQVGTENGRSYRDWSSKLSRAPEALGRLWAAEVVESFVATLCLLKSLGYRVSTLTLSGVRGEELSTLKIHPLPQRKSDPFPSTYSMDTEEFLSHTFEPTPEACHESRFQFALGTFCWYLLSLKYPYTMPPVRNQWGDPPSRTPSPFSSQLTEVLTRLTELEPENRYPSLDEALAHLRAALQMESQLPAI